MRHLNLLNAVAMFFAKAAGAALSPIDRQLRRLECQVLRYRKRQERMQRYPYCGKRQRARYGRQVAEGRLKRENGLAA